MYRSTKILGPYSCAFRQHRATSHCRLLHGYGLTFEFIFESMKLDSRNWVVDFGGFADLKKALEQWFDHTVCVAQDDPMLPVIRDLESIGACDVRILPATGCEMFAVHARRLAEDWLTAQPDNLSMRVSLREVHVKEHPANSAILALY